MCTSCTPYKCILFLKYINYSYNILGNLLALKTCFQGVFLAVDGHIFYSLFFVLKRSDYLYPLPECDMFENCIVSTIKQLICEYQIISSYLPSLWLTIANLPREFVVAFVVGAMIRIKCKY